MNLKPILSYFVSATSLITCLVLATSISSTAFADETMQNGQSLEIPVSSKSAITQYDLNLASTKELASIKGIGIKKAQAIVAYRELHGEFESVEQVTKVKGLGNKLLQKLTPYIIVNPKQNK